MVKKVAISFEGSRRYLNPAKVVWTGCPCRHSVAASKSESLRVFVLEENKKTILLLGGSQGSQKLNEVFFELMKDPSFAGFQAIHMTGKKEFSMYEARYRESKLPAKVFAFIDTMQEAYAAADIVIARAGAGTVSELGLLGLPAVLVPYPFAGNHQKYNAEVLAQKGTAIVIEQNDLTKSSLKEAATRLLLANLPREEVLKKTRGLFQTDAALQLALVAEGL
jgi:UDP-N-acetylglucosamine--N-acetylmuramyl-(pentapeptide) pyrophosphoryl-undecaprenol N-acetylglucosamine transferase